MLPIRNSLAERPGPLRLLVYGASGCGKTTFAATFPRPLFVDCEGGLLSVRDRGVDFVSCRSSAEVAEAIETVRSAQDRYDTVVVDSLTEVARLVVTEIGRANTGHRLTLPEWARCIGQVRHLVRSFCALPQHLVLTAQPRNIRGSDGEVLAVKPWLPGRLADEVMAMADLVLYLHGQEHEDTAGERSYNRGLLTVPHRRFFAKDRSGRLPMWVDPTWSALAVAMGLEATEPAVAA